MWFGHLFLAIAATIGIIISATDILLWGEYDGTYEGTGSYGWRSGFHRIAHDNPISE